jgi:phage tail sheath protein FI
MDIQHYDEDGNRLFADNPKRPDVRETVEAFEGRRVDNNYAATYFPDVFVSDETNNRPVFVPSSVAAYGALSYNDSVAFPWFAPAGFNRGALGFVTNTETRLTSADRDDLYDARINPIANFPDGGFVIFGQKTLQITKSALDRVNVRRMLLEVKRLVVQIAEQLLFEPNNATTRARFTGQVAPVLALVQSQQGIEKFAVIMDDTNNTQDDVEQNRLNGKIVLVPTRAIEFIAIDFIITNSGVEFV